MSNPNRSVSAATKHHNRIAAIMLHGSRYSQYPTSRLAADMGVSKSTISHLRHGRVNPLYNTAAKVVKCLERDLGQSLDVREVFSEDGSYPTPHVCALVGCRGCLPPFVWNQAENVVKPAFQRVEVGRWTGDTLEPEFLVEQERSQ